MTNNLAVDLTIQWGSNMAAIDNPDNVAGKYNVKISGESYQG